MATSPVCVETETEFEEQLYLFTASRPEIRLAFGEFPLRLANFRFQVRLPVVVRSDGFPMPDPQIRREEILPGFAIR